MAHFPHSVTNLTSYCNGFTFHSFQNLKDLAIHTCIFIFQVVFKEMNINPKNISVDGKCLNGSASLTFSAKEVFLSFNFTLASIMSP